MNIILCGYGLAGSGVLEHLLKSNPDRLAIFTHPALPHAPGLGQWAERLGLWWSAENINAAALPFKPDLIISIYYRYIIRPHIIEACGGRIINAHPSLLPKHRGCSSIPWAMIEGDGETGITYHYIDEGIDTGPIILQESTLIHSTDTQASLQSRLAGMVIDLFPLALQLVRDGFKGIAQEGQPSYHPRQCPHGGEIDPAWSLPKVERFIKAMIYPPLPPATFNGQKIYTFEDYQMVRIEQRRLLEV